MRRRILVVPMLVVTALVAAVVAVASPPPGATAVCRDGTYSYSTHRSGTCSHHGGVAKWLSGRGSSRGSSRGSGPVRTGRTILFGRRSRSSGCAHGALPDRRCSPGGYYALLTARAICGSGFRTSAIRNVPQSEKFGVEREYGMTARYYGRSIEIDHIVPLELGGSNAIGNLFPEPGAGPADYHAKDRLENRLRDLVCAGQFKLRFARRQIASNWERLYRKLYGAAP